MTPVPPQVSVIIPAYNAARWLPETLDGLRAQTFADWEAVIADDGSTDDTADVIASYSARDPRIRMVSTPQNSGRCLEPRLLAAENARAELVMPVDADDLIEPDFIERQMRRREETGADIVLPQMWRFKGDGKPYDPIPDETFDLGRMLTGRKAMGMTLDGWQLAFIAGLCRRDFYLNVAARLPIAQDNVFLDEFLSRLLLDAARMVAFSGARYLYRQNEGSVTHVRRASRLGFLLNQRLLRDYTASRYGAGSPEAVAAMRGEFHALIDAIRLHRDEPETSKTEYQEAEKIIRLIYGGLDFRALRGHVSPKYLTVMRLGLAPARFIISLYDRGLKR